MSSEKHINDNTSQITSRYYTVFQKSDAKIQITITKAYLIRIKYPFSVFSLG